MSPKSSLSLVIVSFLLIFILLNLLYRAFRWNSPLSKIPGPPLPSWLKGHMDQLFNRQAGPQFHLELIEKYDRVAKVYGFLGDEQLYISDPLAMQSIIVKDQDIFEETKVFVENNKIIFGEGLVATTGEHHKRQRKLINPVFSMHRLKTMVPIFYSVAHRFRASLASIVQASPTFSDNASDLGSGAAKTDMSEWLSRATLESIGQAGLGYSFDPLDSLSNNPYTQTVRGLIPVMFQIAPLRLLTPFITKLGPPSFRRFLLDYVPIKAVQTLKEMSDLMDKTCKEILHEKREAYNTGPVGGTEDVIGDGKDVMSILITANESADKNERLSEAELLGQMNVLIFGAQDTTASALSRIIYLLSRPEHVALQAQLRKEIVCAMEDKGGSDLDYEELSELPLLDAVLKETLRLYPPVPFVRRMTTQATSLPLSRPILLADRRTAASNITIPRGTTVWVSITGANRLKDVWGPDADQWKPERWLKESPGENRGSPSVRELGEKGSARFPGIYSGMMTFLGGGRSCIGYRFAVIEMKIILLTLLSSFFFTATDDDIVWNLSQILSPSVREMDGVGNEIERQGMPVSVSTIAPAHCS